MGRTIPPGSTFTSRMPITCVPAASATAFPGQRRCASPPVPASCGPVLFFFFRCIAGLLDGVRAVVDTGENRAHLLRRGAEADRGGAGVTDDLLLAVLLFVRLRLEGDLVCSQPLRTLATQPSSSVCERCARSRETDAASAPCVCMPTDTSATVFAIRRCAVALVETMPAFTGSVNRCSAERERAWRAAEQAKRGAKRRTWQSVYDSCSGSCLALYRISIAP